MRVATCVAIVLCLVLAGCGATRSSSASVESKLRRHLAERSLSVEWVRCIEGPESAYRCNVNFGDPHVQIYCVTVVEGQLRGAEWRPAVHGRQNRTAAQRECLRRLGRSL
jgi:hypothetical protein